MATRRLLARRGPSMHLCFLDLDMPLFASFFISFFVANGDSCVLVRDYICARSLERTSLRVRELVKVLRLSHYGAGTAHDSDSVEITRQA